MSELTKIMSELNLRDGQADSILRAVWNCPKLFRHLKENGRLEDFVNDLTEKWWDIVKSMLKNGAPRWLAESTAWELISEEIAAEEASLS